MSVLQNGGGELLTDQGDILSETVNYYTKLYTEEENLMSWIKTIYNGTHSSTQINGHESVRFPLTRGVRQGCLLSAIFYSSLAETPTAVRINI